MNQRLFRALALVTVLGLVFSASISVATAAGKKRGKRAVGGVSSYDSTSGAITVDMRDGSSWSGTVTEATKIKVEHRGWAGTGKPAKPTMESIEVGDKVLKLKARSGEVRKIRIRKAASLVEDAPAGECKDAPETTEEPLEEPVEESTEGEAGTLEEHEEEVVEEDPVEEDSEDGGTCADKVEQDDDEVEEEVEEEVVEEPAEEVVEGSEGV